MTLAHQVRPRDVVGLISCNSKKSAKAQFESRGLIVLKPIESEQRFFVISFNTRVLKLV